MEFVRSSDLDFRAGLKVAAGLGYRYIEPMVHTGWELLSEVGYYHSFSMEEDPLLMKELCEASGLRVSSFSAHSPLMKPEPRPTSFVAESERLRADSFEPLKAAVAKNEIAFNALARGAYPGRRLPQKVLEGIMTVGYWDARSNQTWGLDWHRNEGIELTYLARGKIAFAVDKTDFQLSHGHLTVTRPWQLHRVGKPFIAANRLHWIILDLKVRRPHHSWVWPKWMVLCERDRDELTRLLQYNEHPVWRADARIENCFESIAFAVDQSASKLEESLLRLRINELFLEVLRLLRQQDLTLDERLSSRKRSVEVFLTSLINQTDQPWTLDLMAEQCGLAGADLLTTVMK